MIPDEDMHKLKSLSRATRGGTLDPQRLAESAYRMGSETAQNNAITPETLNLTELEKGALAKAISLTGGKITEAAELLGIGKTTVYRKVKEYGLLTH